MVHINRAAMDQQFRTETSANNKKSADLIYLLDLKPGGKRYEITTWVAKRTAVSYCFKHGSWVPTHGDPRSTWMTNQINPRNRKYQLVAALTSSMCCRYLSTTCKQIPQTDPCKPGFTCLGTLRSSIITILLIHYELAKRTGSSCSMLCFASSEADALDAIRVHQP